MPDFPIVDAHVHLYDPGRVAYPWMRDEPKLDSPHLPADYRCAIGGTEVEAVVFVEVDAAADQRLAEAEFVAGLAATDPLVAGLVAAAGLDEGGAELDAVAAVPGVRGIRQLIQAHADEPGWCLRERFVEGVKGLASRDLSFDLCLFHPQLADATELVRRCPEVRFVLDHIGKPGIRAGLAEPWRRDIAALAALPNVWCKISGVVTEADHAAWTEAEVAPYVAHAIEVFGYRRCMFGGDWPVSELATRYPRWVALVEAVTAGASSADRRRLWRETAIEFYRLEI
jgi:L-fuconolactonase